ncbi:hypothetical protein BHE74_00013265 [Ensete ventricosum]|nr:hypothetical protein GW17_00029884 [Ensete ventricosum]RWW78516.1 hypothetical protein BHE74_00013265 [Ensete ventricosum]RZS15386.1 hypothetical protein BHM03_00047224 [Ensete ventricosum]
MLRHARLSTHCTLARGLQRHDAPPPIPRRRREQIHPCDGSHCLVEARPPPALQHPGRVDVTGSSPASADWFSSSTGETRMPHSGSRERIGVAKVSRACHACESHWPRRPQEQDQHRPEETIEFCPLPTPPSASSPPIHHVLYARIA